MFEFQPNFTLATISPLWTVPQSELRRGVRRALESFFDLFHLEGWLASWQKEKIRRNPKTATEGSLIEATDSALIFLPRPRGPIVFQKFKERLSI
jgi:hypothetical protein